MSARPFSRSGERPQSRGGIISARPNTAGNVHSQRSLTKLTDMRRKKLENLQAREQLKGRRARLLAMLTQKLTHKYGTVATNSRLNRAITDVVSSFLEAHTVVTDSALIELEENVKAIARDFKNNRAPSDAGNRPKTSSRDGRPEFSQTNESYKKTNNEDIDFYLVDSSDKNRNEWSLLNTYKAIEFEEEQKKYQNKLRNDKLRFKSELDKHINEARRQKDDEKEAEETYIKEMHTMQEKWQREEAELRDRIKRKQLEEKAGREEQIRLRELQREREKVMKAKEEEYEIALCQRALKRAEEAVRRRKDEERERLQSFLHDNVVEQERRAELARIEAEEDARLMEAYKAKLDREEAERAEEFRKRMERYEEYGRIWANEGAGRKQRDEELRLEQMVLNEARKKEEADLRKEHDNEERRRKEKLRMLAENRRIIEHKRHQSSLERDEEMAYARQFRMEGEMYAQKEKERLAARRTTQVEHKQMLQDQIAENRRNRAELEMNDAERSINRTTLDRVRGDRDMMQKIKEKLTGTGDLKSRGTPSKAWLERTRGKRVGGNQQQHGSGFTLGVTGINYR